MKNRRKGNSSAKKKGGGKKKSTKQQQNDKEAKNGTVLSGKPKSHTVGDLSGGWFGDDGYATVSSAEDDISEARITLVWEEALRSLRSELQKRAHGALERCGFDRSKAVEEMKRFAGNWASRSVLRFSMKEEEALKLAEDAVDEILDTLDAVSIDEETLAEMIREEQDQRELEEEHHKQQHDVMVKQRPQEEQTQKQKQTQKQNQKVTQAGADLSGQKKSHTVGDGDDDYEAVSSPEDDMSEPTISLEEEEALKLAKDAVHETLDAVPKDGETLRLGEEMRKEQDRRDMEEEQQKQQQEKSREQLAKAPEKAVDAGVQDLAQKEIHAVKEDHQQTVKQFDQVNEGLDGPMPKPVGNTAETPQEKGAMPGETSKAKKEEAIRIELKDYVEGILRRCYMNRAKAVAEMKDLIASEISLQEDVKLRLAEEAVDNYIVKGRQIAKQHQEELLQRADPTSGYAEVRISYQASDFDFYTDPTSGTSEIVTPKQPADGDQRTWKSNDAPELPNLTKNWFESNHRVHPPIGSALVDDSWRRLAMTEMEGEEPERYKINIHMSDQAYHTWYTAAYVDPSVDFIYYAEQGDGAKLNPTTGVWWYYSEEDAKVAVKRVVAAAQKLRRDAAASGFDNNEGDESLWELCAHLPLSTDCTCDTCGRRAVAIWVEHGSKDCTMAQCLTCQTIRFIHSYEGPYREWPTGTKRFQIGSQSDSLAQLPLARLSDFDPRSIGDTPECIQCGNKIKPAREDAVVVLRPCCGKVVCVECANPPKDGFGRSECTLCGGSLSSAVGNHHDNFIIRGKCGHTYHFECLHENSCDTKLCPQCPERWETTAGKNVQNFCACGEPIIRDVGNEGNGVTSLLLVTLLKKASAGHGYAQYFLGLHHCDISTFCGGGKKTLKFGVELLERAMKSGYVPAFRMLARIHCEGICEVEKSIENANYLFDGVVDEEMAKYLTPIKAELCLVSAKNYREGGDRYNFARLVKRAAQEGNAEAIGILGTLYLGSRLKSKDEIIEMFLTAAANGDQTCRSNYRFHLANLYREEGDIAKYIKNLKWASNCGHVEATYLVGAYYLVGLYGCKKDPDMARLYLDRARGMGHAVAQEVISARLKRSMQLAVYFDVGKTQRICINIDPSSTIKVAKEMMQIETGVSVDAFDLEPIDEEQHLTDDTLVDDIFLSHDQPPFCRETLCKAREIFPGAKLFGACDGWAYNELKAANSKEYAAEDVTVMEHIMLKCIDRTCKVSRCGLGKLRAQHAAICFRRASGGCSRCQTFWGLIKCHVLRCENSECSIPGCIMWQKKKEEANTVGGDLPFSHADGAEV